MTAQIDRVGTLGADKTPVGLVNFPVMKSDPVWAQLAGEIAAQQTLVIELKTRLNALLVKLDADGGITDVDYASTLTATSRNPEL